MYFTIVQIQHPEEDIMAQTVNIDKNYFSYDGKHLTIFKKYAFVENENFWVVPTFLGINAEVPAEKIAIDFEVVIQQDIDEGKSDQINHIHTSVQLALCLFCEGVIKEENIITAEENSEYILFKDVKFKNGTFDVRAYNENKYDRATINSDGNVV